MFNHTQPSRRRRGDVDALTLVGGSSEALGTSGTPVQRLVAAQPPQTIMASFNPAIRAAQRSGVPRPGLDQLVEQYADRRALDEQQRCLATAVYFESMGEPLEGQLAVARVVINRAASGRYPTTLCAVVKQKAQFSFVRARPLPAHRPGLCGVAQGPVDRPHRGRQCQRQPAD